MTTNRCRRRSIESDVLDDTPIRGMHRELSCVNITVIARLRAIGSHAVASGTGCSGLAGLSTNANFTRSAPRTRPMRGCSHPGWDHQTVGKLGRSRTCARSFCEGLQSRDPAHRSCLSATGTGARCHRLSKPRPATEDGTPRPPRSGRGRLRTHDRPGGRVGGLVLEVAVAVHKLHFTPGPSELAAGIAPTARGAMCPGEQNTHT